MINTNINFVEELNWLLSYFPKIQPLNWINSAPKLVEEINKGECYLEIKNNELVRKVESVRIYCQHTNSEGQRFNLVGTTPRSHWNHIKWSIQKGELPINAAIQHWLKNWKLLIPKV